MRLSPAVLMCVWANVMMRLDTGEVAEPMPGGSPDFVVEEDDSLDSDESSPPLDLQLPSFVVRAIQVSTNAFSLRSSLVVVCA